MAGLPTSTHSHSHWGHGDSDERNLHSFGIREGTEGLRGNPMPTQGEPVNHTQGSQLGMDFVSHKCCKATTLSRAASLEDLLYVHRVSVCFKCQRTDLSSNTVCAWIALAQSIQTVCRFACSLEVILTHKSILQAPSCHMGTCSCAEW